MKSVSPATASVHDVAKFILQQSGEMTVMKLQKLLYYAQAWHMVWEEQALFHEKIEAWANGPVIREVYEKHRGEFRVGAWGFGSVDNLNAKQKDTIKKVLKFYGNKTAQWLSDLSHREKPWIEARQGIPDGERGSSEITPAAMHEYYSGI